MSRHVLQKYYNPVKMGINLADASAAQTSNTLRCDGFNQLTLEVDYDDTNSSCTACLIYLEYSHDGTNWQRTQSVGWSSGTGTLSDATYSKTIATTSDNFAVNIPINAHDLRVVVTCSNAASGDLITVAGRLGAL